MLASVGLGSPGLIRREVLVHVPSDLEEAETGPAVNQHEEPCTLHLIKM